MTKQKLTTEALINFKMENYLNIVKNPMSLMDVTVISQCEWNYVLGEGAEQTL